MAEKAVSQIADKSEASALRPVDQASSALQEANEGWAALVNEQKQHCQDLKSGRIRSGVTGQLGKCEIMVGEEKQSGAPVPTMDLRFDKAEAKGAQAQTAPRSDLPVEGHRNPDGTGYWTKDGKIVFTFSDPTSTFGNSKGIDRNFEYDKQGNLTHVTEFGNNVKSNEWTKQADGLWSDGKGHTRRDMAVGADGTLTYKQSDGTRVTEKADGSIKFQDGRTGKRQGDGSYEEKDQAGHVLRTRDWLGNEKNYDGGGHLTSSKTAYGETTYYAKDGHQTRKTDRNGASEEYDTQGRVTKSTDARKHDVEFKYDAAGRASMTKDGKQLPVEVHKDGSYSYKNPRSGEEVTHYLDGSEIQKNGQGQLDEVTDAKGHKSMLKYDSSGKVTELTIDGKQKSMAGVKVDAATGDIMVHIKTEENSWQASGDYVTVYRKDGTESPTEYDKAEWK